MVVLTITGWIAASNHCALAALPGAAAGDTFCHGGMHRPAKAPVGDEQSPCCKTLRAVAVKNAPMGGEVFDGAYAFSANGLGTRFQTRQLRPLESGPPDRATFVELVLQRSLLAHAPPSFA